MSNFKGGEWDVCANLKVIYHPLYGMKDYVLIWGEKLCPYMG